MWHHVHEMVIISHPTQGFWSCSRAYYNKYLQSKGWEVIPYYKTNQGKQSMLSEAIQKMPQSQTYTDRFLS